MISKYLSVYTTVIYRPVLLLNADSLRKLITVCKQRDREREGGGERVSYLVF